MKYSTFIVALGLLACKSSKPTSQFADSLKSRLIKEYAFCKCLQHSSPDSNIVKNDISVSIYADIGGYDEEALTSVDSLAKIAASEIKPSPIADHEGQKGYLISCFEFMNSKRLDSLVGQKKYTDPSDWGN